MEWLKGARFLVNANDPDEYQDWMELEFKLSNPDRVTNGRIAVAPKSNDEKTNVEKK